MRVRGCCVVRALLAAAEQQLKGQPSPPKLVPWEKGEACQLTLSLEPAAETKAMAAIGA